MITGSWQRLLKGRIRSSCERKAAYPSGDKAERLARKRSERDGFWLLAYQCFECGKWHIGHQKDSKGNWIRIE